ncbi:DUF4007 family protein [Sphaerisporangium sp. NPDC051011]|uniref:DUF4007 family protein n=1 Tax=Sphaerisporangium sp. NPDC051011 TaxID=3155792 RepID=UPI0033F17006
MSETKLADAAVFSFARHETFAPRFGWLHKAYSQVSNDSRVFLHKEAPVTLGVGKNMVNAIRYWAQAFKLTAEHAAGGTSRANAASPTWEARWLLDEDGADPYLEDPGSLWLLHWWLLSPDCLAPTWWVAFHALPNSRFTEAELTDLVVGLVRNAGWEVPALASIAKDVDCLTKMYAPRKAASGSPGSFEDLLDCPFRELGLLESVESSPGSPRTWRFTSNARTSLPARVAAYACLDYAARYDPTARTVSLARLANEPGGPGRAFRMGEPALTSVLEEACALNPQLKITNAVGQRSLVFSSDPSNLAWDILDAHYGGIRVRGDFPTPSEWRTQYPALAKVLNKGRRPSDQLVLTEEIA